ncbi:hypothetical protein ACA910_003063 [Epithemia clementina (nom. ined.)]
MKRAFNTDAGKATTQQAHSSSSAAQPQGERAKRGNHSVDNDEESFTQEELSKMSRSERKRHREKRRRNDVNKGFEDLMTLLLEIDPGVQAEAEDRARRSGQLKSSQDDNLLLSRVDLISRTVEVLRRVHKENEERKVIIEQLIHGASSAPQPNLSSISTFHAQPQPSLLSLPVLPALGSQTTIPLSLFLPASYRQQQQQDTTGLTIPPQHLDSSSLIQRALLSSTRSQELAASNPPSISTNLLSNSSLLQQQMADSNFINQANRFTSNTQHQLLPGSQRQLLPGSQQQGADNSYASQIQRIEHFLRLQNSAEDTQGQSHGRPPGGFQF